MQMLPMGSQRGWDGWGGWGMVLSVHCRTRRGGEKTLFNQPLCILGIVRISDGSSKTHHQPQQRTELRPSGEKTKKKPPEEPHELGYRTTSSASATHLPNKQTNKQILPLPFPSSHHGQTSLCRFCFYLLFFEWEEAAAKKWRRMSAARLCATLALCLETEHADEEEARRDHGKAKSSPQENFNVPTNRTI